MNCHEQMSQFLSFSTNNLLYMLCLEGEWGWMGIYVEHVRTLYPLHLLLACSSTIAALYYAFVCWTEIGTPIFHASSLLYTTPLCSPFLSPLTCLMFQMFQAQGVIIMCSFFFSFSLSFWGLYFNSVTVHSSSPHFFIINFIFSFKTLGKKKQVTSNSA